jgi:hypothetical protein
VSKSAVEVEEPRRWHRQRACDGEHDVNRRVALSVFDARHVAASDARSGCDVELADTSRLTELAYTTAEPDARARSLIRDFARHPHSLRPQRRPTTSQGGFMTAVTPTLIDDSKCTYLLLRVAVAHDHAEDTPTQTRWCADVADASSPLAGLYAFGASLPDVRDAIATLAWAAVVAGELRPYNIDGHTIAGIHVVTTECAVYEAAWLTTAIANDAA